MAHVHLFADPTSSPPVERDYSRSRALRQRAHRLIPGGCHTYAKGDDQYPEKAPGFIARGPGQASWPVCPPQPWEVAFRTSRASRPYRRLFSASDTTTGLRSSHGNSPVLSEGIHAA
jgi:hypothetical protein